MILLKKQMVILFLCFSQLFGQQLEQQQEHQDSADPERPVQSNKDYAEDISSVQVPVKESQPGRWKRHIGSVAAFGGLTRFPPGIPSGKSFNFYPQMSALTTSTRDIADKAVKAQADHKLLVNVPEPELQSEEQLKDKRQPEPGLPVESFASGLRNQWDSALMHRIQQRLLSSGNLLKQQREFSSPMYTEARSRALQRLVRLLSELQQQDPRSLSSKSKKFLGALARSNSLPTVVQRPIQQQRFRGSTAIPLPGKRGTSFMNPNVIVNTNRIPDADDYSDDYKLIADILDEADLNLNDDDYEPEPVVQKRNLASLARAGWGRPALLLNRY